MKDKLRPEEKEAIDDYLAGDREIDMTMPSDDYAEDDQA